MEQNLFKVLENGIEVTLNPDHSVPGKCKTFFNPKMKINREFCLATLDVYCSNSAAKDKPVKCLDAFAGTGITGMQWKRHLHANVSVTINDVSENTCSRIVETVLCNGLTPLDSDGSAENERSSRTDIEVTCLDANILLHQRQFHFVHLDPFGGSCLYFDATFRNVYNNGIIIITSTDVSALYGTCPNTALRNYSARLVRIDGYKELAARTILAAMARSAAKCNKGFEVLYCLAREHFVHVAVRVRRGASYADECIENVQNLLHCMTCQQSTVDKWDFQHPVELSSRLPCSCHRDDSTTSHIKRLGPVWCGKIFESDFLVAMRASASNLKLSDEVRKLLDVMELESRIESTSRLEMKSEIESENRIESESKISSRRDDGIGTANDQFGVITSSNQDVSMNHRTTSNHDASSNRCTSNRDISRNGDSFSNCCTSNRSTSNRSTSNRSTSNRSTSNRSTPSKHDTSHSFLSSSPPSAMFYFCYQRRHIKGVNFPKISKLVSLLNEEGYPASRTHFEVQAVRTNAPHQRIVDILAKHCSQS